MIHRENPRAGIIERGGTWWHEDPDDPAWILVGFAPAPHGLRQTIRYHLHHGRLMRYPWHAVIPFAWRNRRSFDQPG